MNIKLKYNNFQIAMEIIGAIVLLGMVAYLILNWGGVPDKVPGHYNAAGAIDQWTSKNHLLVLPITGAVLYLVLTLIGFFPAIWNVPVQITEENKEKVYGSMKSMLVMLKAELICCFSYITYNSMAANTLSPYFLPIVLIVVLGTPGFFIVRVIKLSKGKKG